MDVGTMWSTSVILGRVPGMVHSLWAEGHLKCRAQIQYFPDDAGGSVEVTYHDTEALAEVGARLAEIASWERAEREAKERRGAA